MDPCDGGFLAGSTAHLRQATQDRGSELRNGWSSKPRGLRRTWPDGQFRSLRPAGPWPALPQIAGCLQRQAISCATNPLTPSHQRRERAPKVNLVMLTHFRIGQRESQVHARTWLREPLNLAARQTNVSVARLAEGRDRELAGAATALKERERDDRDDEIARLKSKVGEITMDNELLYAKIAALEGKRPLASRRSRR